MNPPAKELEFTPRNYEVYTITRFATTYVSLVVSLFINVWNQAIRLESREEKFIELEQLFLLDEMIKEYPETHLQIV